MIISLKRKSFFPIFFKMRRYGFTWYSVGRCCGMDHYALLILLKITFVFKDKYYWRCPQCGKIHANELVAHLSPYIDKEMRMENKKLDDFRDEV